jgi:hypothetical protein
MSSMTRTRQSLGSQLREALDEMVEAKQIERWALVSLSGDGRLTYRITDGYSRTDDLTPGEAMDWVNAYGYGVRFGRV